jgi:hypothetical protein
MEPSHQELKGFETTIRKSSDMYTAITLDLECRPGSPDADRPWMCRVSVALLKPGCDGVADDKAEIEELEKLYTGFLESLKTVRGKFVAMVTANSVRSWITYMNNPDGVAQAIRDSFAGQSNYTPAVELEHDSRWAVYDPLYPKPEELAHIRYKRAVDESLHRARAMSFGVVKNLRRDGDDMSPREINYSIGFPTSQDREAFIQRLDEKASKIGKIGEPAHGKNGFRFSLDLSKVDAIDLPRIGFIEKYLIQLATAHGGRYGGWGCFVQKPKRKPE